MDLDLTAGFILIRGKGSKERVVPLGGRVCELVKNYILAVLHPFKLLLHGFGEKELLAYEHQLVIPLMLIFE